MKYKKLIKNSMLTLIGNSVSRTFFIFLSIVTANILTGKDFYNITMIISTINMLVSSYGFAAGIGLIKSGVEYNNSKTKKAEREYTYLLGLVVWIPILICLLSFVFFKLISKFLFAGEFWVTVSFLMLSVLAVYYAIISSLLISLEKFLNLAVNKVIYGLLSIFISGILIFTEFEVLPSKLYLIIILLAFFYLSGILPLLKIYISSDIYIKPKLVRLRVNDINYFIKIVFPALISNGVYSISIWLQILVISFFGDRTIATEVAIGMIWFNAISYVSQILSTVILPRLVSGGEIMEMINKGLVLSLLSSCIMILFVLIIKAYINQIYNYQFKKLDQFIFFLSLAAVPNGLCKIMGQFFISQLKMNMLIYFNLGWSVIYIVLSYVFIIKGFSSVSIAYSLLISYFLLFLIQLYFSRKSKWVMRISS